MGLESIRGMPSQDMANWVQKTGMQGFQDDADKRTKANGALTSLNDMAKGQTSSQMSDILNAVATGKMSSQDAVNAAKSIAGGTDKLYTDPTTGSKMASDFIQHDALTSGLFGKGGIQDQAQGQFGTLASNLDEDRNALKGRDESYGLKDSDLKAYGQASGNIARLFGQQEQNLSQMLADRGLDAGASGVAGAGYSGLMGNKMEQLAGLQQQIAQNRIQTAQGLAQARTDADLKRQGQNNSLMQGLGEIGQNAMQNQYGRQLAGAEHNYNTLAGTAAQNLQNQVGQQNIKASDIGIEQATKQPSLGDALGKVAQIGLGAVTGGFGSKAGSKLGSG